MRVGLNGCGRVGKALLQHWLDQSALPQVIFIRTSKKEWYSEEGFSAAELERFLRTGSGMEERALSSPADLVEKYPVDVWFELTPTLLESGEKVLERLKKLASLGVSLVIANKAPVLQDYRALQDAADAAGSYLGLSAVMGASLPSFAIGHDGTLGARVLQMAGILNGTTNFILKEMEEGRSFEEALEISITQGIAEPHYAYDVDGIDAAVKMTLLASVIENRNVSFQMENIQGIREVTREEVLRLKKEGQRIKLIARYQEGIVRVQPEKVSCDGIFYHVKGSEKALWIETDTLSDMTVLGGRSGLREVAASMHRDLLWIQGQKK